MNDLDLVRTLRADVPSPSPARLAAGRSRILAAAVTRRRRYWRLAVPVGAVAAAAAVAVVAVLGGTATPSRPGSAATPSRPGAAGSHPQPAPRASLAAKILTVAARTVAAESATLPGDRQWIYTRFVQTQTGTPDQSNENWIRFDGLEQAYYQDGQLIIQPESSGSGGPLDSYHALAALPAEPAAILAAARQVVGTTPREWENWSSGSAVAELAPRTVGDAEFDYLAQLLWDAYAAAPPAALAHVYQAMAEIPDVTVTPGLTNALGRAGIGVSANGGVSWLLLDPQTYQVIGLGEKALSRESVMVKGAPITFSGTIAMAWADVAIVADPGQR
ncbi:MAG TPA: CU044_5270 family protein [Streptosporangiaceae bacterium]|nr:CU044_5270 family protein [Streptosporangiaceae bacterium]